MFLLLCAGYWAPAAAAGPDIENKKARETFQLLFKDATQVQWFAAQEYTVAGFSNGGITVKAFFDRNGELTQTLRYYKASQLPALITYHIKKQFARFEIFGVTELAKPSGTSYTIILDGEKDWIRLIMNENGQVQSKKKFRRG